MRRVLLTLCLAAGLAGCGGDDELSPEDYRAELRKICQEADRQRGGVQQPTRPTPEAIADYLTRLRDVNAGTIEKVEALEPPGELRDAHDRALRVSRENREEVDEVIAKLEKGGDPTQVLTEARKDLQASTEARREAAEAVGVPECGS